VISKKGIPVVVFGRGRAGVMKTLMQLNKHAYSRPFQVIRPKVFFVSDVICQPWGLACGPCIASTSIIHNTHILHKQTGSGKILCASALEVLPHI
jgi:hypothetical protein